MIVTDFKVENRTTRDDRKRGVCAYRALFKINGNDGSYLDFKVTDLVLRYSILSLDDMAKMMVKDKLKEQTTEEIFI